MKELVLSLVMEGKIELTGDNFVQLLLEAVNRQPFRLEDLKQVLDQIQEAPVRAKTPAANYSQPAPAPAMQPVQQMAAPTPQPVQPARPVQPAAQPQPQASAPAPGRTAPPAPESKKGKPSLKGNKKEKKEKTKPVKEAPVVGEDGFDPAKAKKKFLLPQAVVMVVLAALVSFGAFTDESGSIAVTNILAVVLVVAVAEIILYREAYVNSRKKGAKPAAAPKKGGKKPAGPGKPAAPGRPAAPSGMGVNTPSRPSAPAATAAKDNDLI